jgi:hypothetical protein
MGIRVRKLVPGRSWPDQALLWLAFSSADSSLERHF